MVIARSVASDSSGTPIKFEFYAQDPNPTVQMNAAAIAMAGGGQAHPNMMPYLTLNVCIALKGSIPSRPD
jgi:microcystin-dependent protein